jgi:hypothetical protein
MSSPAPANETERLAALHALDIVDSPPETAYDEITELAAQICGCPVAYISFISDNRRWLKARYGLPAEVTDAPRESAVCTTTICGTELLVVPDLKRDTRFENSPMVALEPPCRFYCGIPLITDEGYALGTLCVMDFEPRQLSFEQTEALRRLSHQVLAQLELRRKLIEYGQTIKMTFNIWGDAVNTAWFMEAFGLAGRINVSETVAGHGHGLFELESRGPIDAKHERAHEMFFLNGLKKEYSRNGSGHLPNDHSLAEYNRLGGSRLTADR